MPYGQSPWEEAAAGTQNMGNSMTRIMQAQQVGRMRAQQFAAQLAIKQQQEQIQAQRLQQQDRLGQQKFGLDQEEFQARRPLLEAQTDEAKSVTGKNTQEVSRMSKMDELAHAVAIHMYRQRVPGGVIGAMSGDQTGVVGPRQENADLLNQGGLVRDATELMAMKDPNAISTLMMGKNIPRGDVNYNPLTQERVEGLPPAAPTGAPIDPSTGMTHYQDMQVLLQKARMADANKKLDFYKKVLSQDPKYKGIFDSEDGANVSVDTSDAITNDKGNGKKPSRAQAAEYVKQYGNPQAAMKQLQTEGFNTSGYAD